MCIYIYITIESKKGRSLINNTSNNEGEDDGENNGKKKIDKDDGGDK